MNQHAIDIITAQQEVWANNLKIGRETLQELLTQIESRQRDLLTLEAGIQAAQILLGKIQEPVALPSEEFSEADPLLNQD